MSRSSLSKILTLKQISKAYIKRVQNSELVDKLLHDLKSFSSDKTLEQILDKKLAIAKKLLETLDGADSYTAWVAR